MKVSGCSRIRWALLLVLALGVLALGAGAQEAASCDCSGSVQEANAALETCRADLAAMTSAKDRETQLNFEWRDYSDKIKAQADAFQAKATEADQALAAVQAQLAAKEAELAAALKRPASPDLASALAAVGASLKASAAEGLGELNLIAQELAAGKTARLAALGVATSNAFRGAASSAKAFVQTLVDDYLPESAKKQLAAAAGQASEFWRTNVLDAAWAKPILAQLSSLNEELKRVITRTLLSVPSLAPFADPVYVQLAVYAVFGLPVLVLLVLPLALSSRSGAARAASNGTKKPSKAAKKGSSKNRV